MGSNIKYNVNGIEKFGSDLNYNDLVWLVNEFCNKNQNIRSEDFRSKNNLPSINTVKRILNYENISYDEFMNNYDCYKADYKKRFKKYTVDKYDDYVDRYKSISTKLSRGLSKRELCEYNLPDNKWFLKHCPNKNIKTWLDFIRWCGFLPKSAGKSNKKYKETIIQKLLNYEKELGRPLVATDITTNNVGFSFTVISKIWGSMDNCRDSIGLRPVIIKPRYNFEYYTSQMKIALQNIYNLTHMKEFTWKEFDLYKGIKLDHTSIIKACEREGIDIYDYIESFGYKLVYRTRGGEAVRLDDGEICLSTLELRYSTYLKDNNIQYERDVKYSLIDEKLINRKINCDYVIDNKYWIEICGMLQTNVDNWKTINGRNKIEEDYRQRLLYKEKILKNNNIPYLFLFRSDFYKNEYENKTCELLNL